MKNLLILTFLVFIFASCKDEKKIIGEWTVIESSAWYIENGEKIIFNKDELFYKNIPYDYQVKSKVISIYSNNQLTPWYKIEALNKTNLTLESSSGDHQLELVR